MKRSRHTEIFEKAITDSVQNISPFLDTFGLKVKVVQEPDLPENQLGEYETGSVFEKEIFVKVNLKAIKSFCKEAKTLDGDSVQGNLYLQTTATIYHEIGHALLEQLLDWIDSFPNEAKEIEKEPRFKIVTEDYYPEEELVEDFAWHTIHCIKDPLRDCITKMNKLLT